jgi:hypothetical protein
MTSDITSDTYCYWNNNTKQIEILYKENNFKFIEYYNLANIIADKKEYDALNHIFDLLGGSTGNGFACVISLHEKYKDLRKVSFSTYFGEITIDGRFDKKTLLDDSYHNIYFPCRPPKNME